MSENVVFDAPVRKGGLRGGVLLSSRAQFLAAYSGLKGTRQRFELISALADDVSASLVLRDDEGELLNVLVAFDQDRRIRRVTSFRQARGARDKAGSSVGTPM